LYLGAWLPIGGLLAALLALAGAFSWLEAIAVALPLSGLYAFVCLASYYLCRTVPLRLSSLAHLAGNVLGAAAISASLWVLAGRGWVGLLAWLGLPSAPGRLDPFLAAPTESYRRAVPILFLAGVLLFLLAAALHYAILAFQASREAETRALEFQLLSRDAELKALRAQLHPHFLFNSLNSISALTKSDPDGARRTCVLLGDLLRRSLTLGARERVPLAEEIGLSEKLIAVEQVRFGERLGYESSIGESAKPCLVPPLLLQPLVENAVTHGIAGLLEGGTIRLEAGRDGGRLELVLENPRDPDSPRRQGAGVGLDNVRKRIAALYGSEGRFQTHEEPSRFRVELSLPVQLAHAEPPSS